MSRSLEKRNRQKPFDYDYAEAFTLDGEQDTLLNNSYYFSAHDARMSFFARLGRRINQDETWFALYLDGKVYSLSQELYPAGESPIKVEKTGEKWRVSYKGVLGEKDEVDFDAVFVGKQDPIDFTSNMPPQRMATGIANERWTKAFFSELQNVSGQCHYEQEGILQGSLTLNGKALEFSLPCVRDHSFGRRDWNYMNNHLWLMSVSPTQQFNYSLVSYPAISALEVGNYRDSAGMHYMLKADLDFSQVARGTVPEELQFNVSLDDGRTVRVSAKLLTGVTYHFQNGQYTLYENIAEFVIDGQKSRGILEIGFNGDPGRYFNQRNLNTIKR